MNSWLSFFAGVVLLPTVVLADEATLRLARALSAEGDGAGAALEFRRLALGEDSSAPRAVWFWMAGHAYWRAGQLDQADRMLDRAEDSDPRIASEAVLVRGETALGQRKFDASAFYFESALRASGNEVTRHAYVVRRLAAVQLQRGQLEEARKVLLLDPSSSTQNLAAVQAYAEGRDRSPSLGGWLGVIPGGGYAYAGEYANALRSLILNGLFMWGLVSTAEEEQWGGFAALTFFEITWYTGSIYGGIDASHRYNRRRLERVVDSISAGAVMTPDYEALPALRLKYTF